MKKYTPRRAGARWREDAPGYVLDIFDNRGDSCDRYSVLLCGEHLISDGTRAGTYIPYLTMSDAPSHSQGISMWGELRAWEAAGYRSRCKQWRIKWIDLPEHIRAHVMSRIAESNQPLA